MSSSWQSSHSKLSDQRVGQHAPPQATYPRGQANAGVMAKPEAKLVATRSPIMVRIALSCLHEAPGSLPGFGIGWQRPYACGGRRSVTGITEMWVYCFYGRPKAGQELGEC